MNQSTDPVIQRRLDILSEYQQQCPDKPFGVAVFAAGMFLDWINSLKVQKVGPVFLCSYYDNAGDWNVWVSTYNPKGQHFRHQGGRFA